MKQEAFCNKHEKIHIPSPLPSEFVGLCYWTLIALTIPQLNVWVAKNNN